MACLWLPFEGFQVVQEDSWYINAFLFNADYTGTYISSHSIPIRPNRYTITIPLWAPLAGFLLYPIIGFCRGHFRRETGAPLCPSCGYNLTGNVSGRCPECGEMIEDAAR